MASEDPTRTKTVRRTYARRLRGAFGRINAAIREAVVQDDIFGLRDRGGGSLTAAITKPQDLSTFDEGEQIARFEDWLDEAMDSEVLEVVERGDNRFIQRAYERAVEDADTNLRRAGFDVGTPEVAAVVEAPLHQRTLQALFARNYAELDGITDEVARQVTRELADGLGEGVNPTEMARRISDRVNTIGKTRATVLARTETIHAFTESTLQRYEEFGVEGVTVRAELQTAGDDRVCSICESLEGQVWTIEEARSETTTIDGSEFPVRPPIHPQCRCSLLPVGGG